MKEVNKTANVSTGPYQFVEWVPDSHVKLKRFDGYVPSPAPAGRDGLGGRKTAYFDTITIRIIREASARVAALESGQVHFVEDVPIPAAKRLESNTKLKLVDLMPSSQPIIYVNTSLAPTSNLKLRQAIQAALDIDEILAAATDGNYQLNPGWVYPASAYYVPDAGRALYNQKNLDEGEGAPDRIRLQGRAAHADDEQGLPVHVQVGGGHLRAAQGARRQRQARRPRLADDGRQGPDVRRLEPRHLRLRHPALRRPVQLPQALLGAGPRGPRAERRRPRPGLDEVQHLAQAGRPQGRLGADPAAHGRPGLHPEAGRPGLQARHGPETSSGSSRTKGRIGSGTCGSSDRPGPCPPSRRRGGLGRSGTLPSSGAAVRRSPPPGHDPRPVPRHPGLVQHHAHGAGRSGGGDGRRRRVGRPGPADPRAVRPRRARSSCGSAAGTGASCTATSVSPSCSAGAWPRRSPSACPRRSPWPPLPSS